MDIQIQNQDLTFEGKIVQETITGTFTQQGQSVPFELAKGETEEVEEPQEEGESIQTEVENGTMQALLEIPGGEGPFPVMILIAGSGPTDKNGNSPALPGKNNSLKLLAKELAAEGIATIRYDKRGVGDNMALVSSEQELRFNDYIQDVAAWVRYAKNSELFSTETRRPSGDS
ncbi:alpha/beta hydrolase family protein [Planococcus lenghuensis]|nr:hypothetical protein [Planococcus lenghuensis]